MIRKVLDNKYSWNTLKVLVFLSIFIPGTIFNEVFNKFVNLMAIYFGIAGISISAIIDKFKNKSWFKDKLTVLLAILSVSILVTFSLNYFGITYKTPVGAEETGSTELKDEEVVTADSENMNNDEDFYPVLSPEQLNMDVKNGSATNVAIDGTILDLVNNIDDSLSDILTDSLSAKDRECYKTQLETTLKNKIGTGFQPTDDEVNGNIIFSDLTQSANDLEKQLKEKGMDIDLLLTIIEKRESAYKIYETTSLRKMLANDYTKLGKYYFQMGYGTKANVELLKAIMYECEYLKMLKTDDDDYYTHIYKIGMIYQLIADLREADYNYRIQSLILSSCFLEIAALNIDLDSNEKYFFFSTYYNAMVNHKLAIFLQKDQDCYVYINSALDNYIKSTVASNYRKQRDLQFTYILQVIKMGKDFRNKFGGIPDFPSWSELDQIEKQYSQLLQRY